MIFLFLEDADIGGHIGPVIDILFDRQQFDIIHGDAGIVDRDVVTVSVLDLGHLDGNIKIIGSLLKTFVLRNHLNDVHVSLIGIRLFLAVVFTAAQAKNDRDDQNYLLHFSTLQRNKISCPS